MVCKPFFHLPVLLSGKKKEPEDFSDSYSCQCLEEGNRVGEIYSPLSHHRTCRSAYGGST